MGTVSLTLPSDGSTADVSDYNTPLNTLTNEFNGNIENANIKAGAAIATTKLATDAGIVPGMVNDGFVVQVASVASGSVSTGSTQIPVDNTIPQNTEGDEYMTLAITPKSATNILVIEAVVYLSNASANRHLVAALFQDSTADALAANSVFAETAAAVSTIVVKHRMVAGTTSATTFKIRAGTNSTGTTTFNGSAGAVYFGAATKSSVVITEYKAS